MSNHTFLRDRMRKGSRSQHTPRNRAQRPRTFKTEEAANAWAKQKGVSSYRLENMKNEDSKQKKLRIVTVKSSAP